MTPIGVMMVHIGPDMSSPLLGAVPQEIPKFQNFGRLKIEYVENSKSQHYNVSIRA